MSENSLFAILLRSRWWMSFLLCVAVIGLSKALLPKDIWIYGAAGGFPFLVIGCIAFWRQMGQLTSAKSEQWLQEAGSLSWPQFADKLQSALQSKGYIVTRSKGASGADFEAELAGRLLLVSAKRWKAANTGLEPLQELQKTLEQRDSGKAMLITLSAPSPKAQEFARQQGIQLLFGPALAQWFHSK